VEEGQEVARLVGEPSVGLVGLRALLERAFAGVLDAQGRDDRHDLPRHAVLPRLDDHAPEPRVDGEPGELAADLGDGRYRSLRLALRSAQRVSKGVRTVSKGAARGRSLRD